MEIELLYTDVFEKNYDTYYRKGNGSVKYIINQGGTRSSKTYSILQLLIFIGLNNKRCDICIVRESVPNLKKTVVEDMITILNDIGIYDDNCFNKTELIYKFKQTGSRLKFISTDEPSKLRGLKSDILYINEVTSIEYEAFMQLTMRCKGKIFVDFNPSDSEHYVFDLLKTRPSDCELIKSTYKDNPFLPESQVREIEALIKGDESFYKIYVLGEAPVKKSIVYSHFKFITPHIKRNLLCYAIDFGYNHPAALVALYDVIDDDGYFFEELIYEKELTANLIIERLNKLNVDKSVVIYADPSRPEIIADIKKAGYKIEKANNDVKDGIDCVKSSQIYVDSSALNIQKEYKLYSYKTKNEKILEELIKENDDAMDAIRYALYTYKKKGKITGKIKVFRI